MEILQLKDIACYLPYNLHLWDNVYSRRVIAMKFTVGYEFNNRHISIGWLWRNIDNGMKPILRPISDLNKPFEDGAIPIVELAKIGSPIETEWIVRNEISVVNKTKEYLFTFHLGDFKLLRTGCLDGAIPIIDQIQLFDYLNEHHFDYRGLIDKGLAIDINTINE